ncbi:SPBc2 prophage-derived endonuclease YokF precursor [Pseudodesulfovibrio hydrargyri]|jgi:endonuclease YncB( thermonuclease family)|uniref:SPBc2 prophage-derived endonuclease YokF n=1 Tax=Pseudodesulfovibrio hydrargyri TaxID=2125990 RepID=A0A1J5MTK6_9BACT|nr:thermonuclease family protein [Pseudodesulfovibrio hydrargyri]OIQ49957.1 SPBc2 prophage-derived endonuclease YokF precursor [Pseudodesulfovibrio hydrargyri]
MANRFLSILLLILLFFTGLSHAFMGKVVGVADGDTITVLAEGNTTIKVRLYGIDAPESRQDFGNKAKQNLTSLVFGKIVDMEPMAQDRYGRTVAHIFVDDQDVCEALVRAGMAWVYLIYCREKPTCDNWLMFEQKARVAGVGLWASPSPQAPWEWRRGGGVKGDALAPAPKYQAASGTVYHGNISSHVFHRPGCRHYDCKNCVENFEKRKDAIRAGYKPCQICSP